MSVELPEWPSERAPPEWVNEVTAIAPAGTDDDVAPGERFRVEQEGEPVEVVVVKATAGKSVLERTGSGFASYGNESVGARVRDAPTR